MWGAERVRRFKPPPRMPRKLAPTSRLLGCGAGADSEGQDPIGPSSARSARKLRDRLQRRSKIRNIGERLKAKRGATSFPWMFARPPLPVFEGRASHVLVDSYGSIPIAHPSPDDDGATGGGTSGGKSSPVTGTNVILSWAALQHARPTGRPVLTRLFKTLGLPGGCMPWRGRWVWLR